MITKAYFIYGGNYVRYDAATDSSDAGYPKQISGNWQGFSASGFDAGIEAAVDDNGLKIYFFKGGQYVRYDISSNRIDNGYPLRIADLWPGMSDSGFDSNIDAAVNWGNGKIFFFKGNQYLRYDLAADHTDNGYPVLISDGWPGFQAAGFADSIDAIVNWGNGKVYFFKSDKYLRYDIAADAIDPGYPDDIGNGWDIGPQGRIDAAWTISHQPINPTNFNYLGQQFFAKLKATCVQLNCSAEDLLGVMESESSIQPSAQNPNGKATGLIQFMPQTLIGLGWNNGPDAFRQLSALDQLPYVENYYRPHVGKLATAGRLYLATFLPALLTPNTQEADVVCEPGGINSQFYQPNQMLDTNKDGKITVSDLTERITKVQQGARWDALLALLNGA